MNGTYRDAVDETIITVEDSSLSPDFKMVSWDDREDGPTFVEMHIYEFNDLIVLGKVVPVDPDPIQVFELDITSMPGCGLTLITTGWKSVVYFITDGATRDGWNLSFSSGAVCYVERPLLRLPEVSS